MIFYGNGGRNYYGNQTAKTDDESCLSKIKSFIKQHPYKLLIIISGIIVLIIIVIVLCVVLTKKDKNEETEEIEEIPIYPLEESLKSEVISIYEGIGNNDKGTLAQFHNYLSEKASNLKDEQKVYLAFYWITKNIVYDYDGLAAGTVSYSPEQSFPKRTTVCSGYSRLFRDLLLSMNYPESKILNIVGYSKGSGYSVFTPPESNHEWNAVEINGKWCLIDTTWAAGGTSEYYLCTPPECFVRDHFPYSNESLQFLQSPITLTKFHEIIDTDIGFCKKKVDIIEDKAIQNICGKGKLIIKNKKRGIYSNIEFIPEYDDGNISYFVNRIDDGFQIDLSINNKGLFECLVLYNRSFLAFIYFNCTEEPKEKIYYPSVSDEFTSYLDAKLISPLNGHLKKGEKYNFEIKINNIDNLTIEQGDDEIFMTKNGNTFKEEDVYIHSDSIYIFTGNKRFISYVGIGDDVSYPKCFTTRIPIKLRLFQPLTRYLTKGNTYTFKLRCDSIEKIRIRLGDEFVEMDRNNNIYTKTVKIETTISLDYVYISYRRNLTSDYIYDYYLYEFLLN